MLGGADGLGEAGQGVLAVAQHGYVGMYVLVDLGRVDVEVYHLGLLGIGIEATGDAVVETHAHSDEQVTFVGLHVRTQVAVHTQHTLAQAVPVRQGRESQQGTSHGDIGLLHEGAQLLGGIAQLDALACKQQRAFGGVDEGSSLLYALGVGVGHGDISALHINGGRLEVHHTHLCILGKVEYHGSGASGTCNMEGARYGPSDVLGAAHLVAPFRDRLRDTHEVYLLEGIGAKEVGRHLSGNDHDRRTVEHGIGHARYGVGGTGATRHKAHTHLARRTGIALRSVGGTLLVAHKYLLEIILMVIHGIKHGHDAAAGIAKYGVYALVDECLHECF